MFKPFRLFYSTWTPHPPSTTALPRPFRGFTQPRNLDLATPTTFPVPSNYNPAVGFVCVFSGIGCMLLAGLGAASYTASFSRFAGESFGAVVAGLFFQQAIKISVAQFHLDALYSSDAVEAFSSSSSADDSKTIASLYALSNGVFSLFVACGLVVTALLLRRARSASIGNSRLRGLVADYGAVIATGELLLLLLFCLFSKRGRKMEGRGRSERYKREEAVKPEKARRRRPGKKEGES